MKNNNIPYSTMLISLLTLVYSLAIAFMVNGEFFSNVNLVQLDAYGGLTLDHLKNMELWRLFASQLIHVKQAHMFYNVLSLMALGVFVERYLHSILFFSVWFIAGAIGTIASTLFVEPPWNLGTGGSQAVLGVAGFGLLLSLKKINTSKWFGAALAFAIIPAFALDLIHAGYPKLGHMVSLLIGLVLGFIYLRQTTETLR